MELPPLTPGSDTAVALHRIWNGCGETSVRTTGVDASAAAAATIAAHLARRTRKKVTIWSLHVVQVRRALELWFEPGEVSVTQATETLVRLDVPTHLSDYRHGDVTVLVSDGWSTAGRALAAIDIGKDPGRIRLLPGVELADEPFDVAIAGSV